MLIRVGWYKSDKVRSLQFSMNGANKKSGAELNQLCQAFLFNLQFIKALRLDPVRVAR